MKQAVPCRLPGYGMVFTKDAGSPGEAYANMEYTGDDVECPGVLFQISQAQFARLDRKEGVSSDQYVRIALPVLCEGRGVLAQTYLAHPDAVVTGSRPTDEYRRYIENGYKAWDLGEVK